MIFFKKTFIISFLKLYLHIVLLTCHWKINNLDVLESAILKKRPIMLSCWHENLVFFTCFFKSWKKKIWVVSSTHKDSEILAQILKAWKYQLIKGSSSRGWLSVLKKIMIVFKNNESIIAITHDGPRGPAKKSKPGAIKVALKNKVQIIGMSGEASSFWRARSWDQTVLPKPFSTINLSFYPQYNNKSIDCFNEYLNKNEKRSRGLC